MMNRLLNKIMPFFLIGIAIVAFSFGLMLLAYLLIFGAIVGSVLYLINWVHSKFFAPKVIAKRTKPSGRVIDTDDWKKL